MREVHVDPVRDKRTSTARHEDFGTPDTRVNRGGDLEETGNGCRSAMVGIQDHLDGKGVRVRVRKRYTGS